MGVTGLTYRYRRSFFVDFLLILSVAASGEASTDEHGPAAKNILFVARPLHGHFTPIMPIVKELAARGHSVKLSTGANHIDKVLQWPLLSGFTRSDFGMWRHHIPAKDVPPPPLLNDPHALQYRLENTRVCGTQLLLVANVRPLPNQCCSPPRRACS